MYSIITSAYNAVKMTYDFEGALTNWAAFLGDDANEIIIAVNKSEDDTLEVLKQFCASLKQRNPFSRIEYRVLDCDVPYSDPEFDGKLKDLALKAAQQPWVILMDLDERVYPAGRKAWDRFARKLTEEGRFDAMLIPSVNIFKNERCFSDIGAKWYLHRNLPNIGRGVVKWAYRENGSIDITKSDTTELIYRDSRELVRTQTIVDPVLPDFLKLMQLQNGDVPYVYHIGSLDLAQRAKQNDFWQPVWQNRDKTDVKTTKSAEELDKVQYMHHGLPFWK